MPMSISRRPRGPKKLLTEQCSVLTIYSLPPTPLSLSLQNDGVQNSEKRHQMNQRNVFHNACISPLHGAEKASKPAFLVFPPPSHNPASEANQLLLCFRQAALEMKLFWIKMSLFVDHFNISPDNFTSVHNCIPDTRTTSYP